MCKVMALFHGFWGYLHAYFGDSGFGRVRILANGPLLAVGGVP